MVTLETSPEANCDRETRQADRQKKTLIGAQATVLPKNRFVFKMKIKYQTIGYKNQ